MDEKRSTRRLECFIALWLSTLSEPRLRSAWYSFSGDPGYSMTSLPWPASICGRSEIASHKVGVGKCAENRLAEGEGECVGTGKLLRRLTREATTNNLLRICGTPKSTASRILKSTEYPRDSSSLQMMSMTGCLEPVLALTRFGTFSIISSSGERTAPTRMNSSKSELRGSDGSPASRRQTEKP